MTHRVVHGVGCEDVEESLLPGNTKKNKPTITKKQSIG